MSIWPRTRHHPLAIVPAAIQVGGVRASSGLVQRNFGLPDATTVVFEGLLFLAILSAGALSARLWQPPAATQP